MENLDEIWKVALAQLEVKLDNPAQFKTWLKCTKLRCLTAKKAEIGVKNPYAADWLTRKHFNMIKTTISHICKKDLLPIFVVDKTLSNLQIERVDTDNTNTNEEKPLFGVTNGIGQDLNMALKRSGINPSYTFSSFVVGDSNNLANAAALGVSENSGILYNPLFMYGRTGLGKTHLAQAIARDVLDKDPIKKVFYITSENFMNDMVRAIQTGKNIDFRKKFRTVDVLIIDDIQLISKWPKTQEEIFNTFNILYNNQKQIILTSDISPNLLHDIDDRLKSRFQGGMSVEINKPDLETRYAIIQKKIISMGISLPKKIAEYIAREIKDNVREIEGAIQKISLYNSMIPNELSIEEVAKILGRDTKSKRSKIKVPIILKRVSKEFDVTVKDIKSPKRNANIAFARQVCMYILREEFKYKLEQTAGLLNRKDHTTVIHAVDKIKSKAMVNDGFKEQLQVIVQDLESQNL